MNDNVFIINLNGNKQQVSFTFTKIAEAKSKTKNPKTPYQTNNPKWNLELDLLFEEKSFMISNK